MRTTSVISLTSRRRSEGLIEKKGRPNPTGGRDPLSTPSTRRGDFPDRADRGRGLDSIARHKDNGTNARSDHPLLICEDKQI
jgi:hypothetical protein